MASNEPVGDNARRGAVKKRTQLSVIECFETDGGVNYRSNRLI